MLKGLNYVFCIQLMAFYTKPLDQTSNLITNHIEFLHKNINLTLAVLNRTSLIFLAQVLSCQEIHADPISALLQELFKTHWLYFPTPASLETLSWQLVLSLCSSGCSWDDCQNVRIFFCLLLRLWFAFLCASYWVNFPLQWTVISSKGHVKSEILSWSIGVQMRYCK